MEGLSIADDPEVRGKDGATTAQDGTGGTREPGGGGRMTVPGEAKGGRTEGGAGDSTGQSGVNSPEAEGGALGISCSGEVANQRA